MGKKEASKGKGGKKAAKQKNRKRKVPPLMGIPCPDETWGPEGDIPPWMRGPLPDDMWGPEGDMPPWMMDQYSDEMWGPEGDMPPWMMDQYSDEMWGPDEHMPPDMRGPFPGPRFRGPMPPEMRGPFPGPRFRGPMPPEMRGHFPGPRFRGPMPPGMRGPFSGPRFREPMSPNVRGPFPGPRRGGPMPSQMRDHFPGPRSEVPMPLEMREPFPGPRSGGPIPSEMRDHFPGPRSEGPMPLEMRGPFPGPRSEGPIPPEMDFLPEPRSKGPMPQEMREAFPGPRSEGPMRPEMRGPFLGPQRRGPLLPLPDGGCERKVPIPPLMQGMSQNEMREPRRNVSPWADEPNAPPCAPWPEAGVDAGRPGPSPALWQEELEKYGPAQWENYSFPSGSHIDHLASSKVANNHYLQESAAKILESFGLSNEDLEELSLYPEDQLKPENMPKILKEIRMKKAACQLPELSSQEAVGEDGLYSPSAAQMAMAPVSSESWRINCPTPSMMSDYSGSSPRLFPHTCALCKVECKHLRGWILHLSTPVHLKSCHRLRQQYPEWNPEDTSFNNRSENQAPSQWPGSSSPGPSSSGQNMQPSRSRSRSPLHRREMSPAEAHAKPKNDPQLTALNSLVEKSVSQAMSMLQSGGTGAAGLGAVPSLQLDSAALSLGLVSMMQLVATQVVQTVLSSKEAASEQVKPDTAAPAPLPSTPVSDGAVKQEAAAKTVPHPLSDVVGPVSKRHVLICGHSYIFWADRQARKSSFGHQLGLAPTATVEWRGRKNLRWEGLVPLLLTSRKGAPPDLLVIHLGGGDLGLIKGKAFAFRALDDIRKIKDAWPHTDIVWSAIIPREKWPGDADCKLIDGARKRVNRAMLHGLRNGLGFVIPHPAITHLRKDFFREDGVHLSDAGNHQFLCDLQKGIRAILAGSVKDRGRAGASP